MSLLLAGLVVVASSGALVLGRWLGARRRAPDAATEPASESAPADPMPAAAAALPFALGDVLVSETGEEAWLASGLLFEEGGHAVAALFVAPDEGAGHAIYVRVAPSLGVHWLSPCPGDVAEGARVSPHVLEHQGARFERTRRLPLRARRLGEDAPDVGDVVTLAEYRSEGAARLVSIVGTRGSLAYAGRELDAGTFEIIPSGSATL